MSAMVSLFFLALCILRVNAQDTSVFEVTAPKAGDTISVGKTTTAGIEVPINWTVVDSIRDRPVFITLVQGNDLSSLSRIEQINTTAPNNGSYTWRGDVVDSSLVYNYDHGAPSGCNYSIELKVWTDIIYSGYFTIINPQDGGLNSTSECPAGDAAIGPTNRTYTSDGRSSEGENEPASSSSTGSPSSNTSGASNPESGGGSGGGGVSTTTLAVAVAVPIVVLLLIFGLIIWLGIRKGWFVKKRTADVGDGTTAEKSGAFTPPSGSGKAGQDLFVRELHGNDVPHQLESRPVHELQGGEGGQHYVIRN